MGLLDAFEIIKKQGKQFFKDAMPGGLLNPEVTGQSVLDGAAIATSPVPILGDVLGLGADLNRYKNEPESRTAGNFALSGLGLLPFVPAMTAWHGSPHKFDKFKTEAIGTGEGAQAYGHGLYLAEAPEVAGEYARNLANRDMGNQGRLNAHANAQRLAKVAGDPSYAIDDIRYVLGNDAAHPQKQLLTDTLQFLESGAYKNPLENAGHLYKTDIPDEAVARFLDWDKPLSQQAEHLGKLSDAEVYNLGITREGLDAFTGKQLTGGDLMRFSDNQHGGGFLNKKGIPGIRYLDGGSRSAGQGSSNFVAFDPEMIRILERNGVATGNQPWRPGEWKGLLE